MLFYPKISTRFVFISNFFRGLQAHGSRDLTDGWFIANKHGSAYFLSLKRIIRYVAFNDGKIPVLDEDTRTTRILCWSAHGGSNQQWVFEPTDYGHPYYRIRNLATGRYLTWDHNSGNIYGFRWVSSGHPDYDGQIWCKH